MIKRIGVYLQEMFPITAIIGSILTAVAIQMILLKLNGLNTDFRATLFLPGLVLASMNLLLRVMDEFKDYQDDLKNFPLRPLPSGRVKLQDLKVLAAICVVIILFLSSTSKTLLLWSLITLAFSFLMLKWFFLEKIMKKNLILAVVTHHPIVIFNFVYVMLSLEEAYQGIDRQTFLYVLPLCLMFTNWEVSRKIRAKEQETSYITYSRILGPRVAVSIALFFQLIFNVTMFAIFNVLKTPVPIQAIYALVQAVLLLPYLRFMLTLKLPKPLKPNAEGQILVVVGFLLITAMV